MIWYKKMLLFFFPQQEVDVKEIIANATENVREYYRNNPGAEQEDSAAQNYFSAF